MKMKQRNIGSSFDSWLREEGIHQEVTDAVAERIFARPAKAAPSKQLTEQQPAPLRKTK